LGILIIIVFLAIFLVAAFYSHQRALQRQQELAAFAAQLGWRFDPEKDRSHDDQYPQFGVFKQGHSRYAYNTFLGSIEVDGRAFPVKMGDYHYQETSTDSKGKSSTRTYTFSYLIVRLPYHGLPDLFIRREGIFDAVKRAFGFDDIDFESAEFSKRFFVKCSDKRFAHFDPDPQRDCCRSEHTHQAAHDPSRNADAGSNETTHDHFRIADRRKHTYHLANANANAHTHANESSHRLLR
jgi:hypothetical protein